jgi:hypothetical protein
MEYNTEKINELAQSVAKLVEESLKAKTESGQNQIAEIEKEFREVLRQIGMKALGFHLSSLQKTPESEIRCNCGGQLRYQRMREAKLISVFGKVSYKRAYYAGCQCQKGEAPLDEEYGLKPGAFKAGLAQLMALTGIAFSFEESEKWLSEFLLFEISENSIRSETEGLGLIQKQADEQAIESSQDEKALQERLRRMPKNTPVRLYGSIDAAKVRIEPRAKQGKVVPDHENWRDMKVGCWYQAEPVLKMYQSKRQKAKAERDGTVFRTTDHHYFCDICPADQFGKLLWASGCENWADLVPELVFVCDGAVWIWDLVSHYYQNAKQIVDWYHAEDHLKKLAEAVFASRDERRAWLDPVTELLWQGQVEDVILVCESLEAQHPHVQPTALYFANNAERMRYAQFRAQGYLIGSGTIESGCKQIVTQRLKRSGAQWTVDGAVQTAKARAAWLSGDWASLCIKRSALPLAA